MFGTEAPAYCQEKQKGVVIITQRAGLGIGQHKMAKMKIKFNVERAVA